LQIEFKQQHISIERFNNIELSDFTVLTGTNGSGKSHLLSAIEQKKVIFPNMVNPNIVLFNYETFKLDNEPSFNAQQLSNERESAWQYHNQNIKNRAKSWRSSLGEDYNILKSECKEKKKSLFGLKLDKLDNYKKSIKDFFNTPNIKNNQQSQGIYSLIKKIPYSIDEVEHDEFIQKYKPFVFKNNFLPNQLGKIFWDYHEKYTQNSIREFENEKKGKNHTILSDNEFITLHGEKPWDLVNQILETFDSMQYRVNSPEEVGYFESYQLKLLHTEKEDLQVDFTALSSGEKILMALVASIYKASSDGLFPDILLLDEVDASLHPSMMRNMLNVIEKIFLKQGVKVILVSHSPTTIALSPEASIFIMNKSGINRIEKKSKQEALSILTQGYATIDEGLKLFDEITKNNITIITEGKNTLLIKKALELFNINDIDIITGIEAISGKSQLKTLFDFLSKTNHNNKVIFIWDCDVNYNLNEENKPILISS
jgi:predicted ATPase